MTTTLTLQAFQSLRIPQVSYQDYLDAGGVDAVRTISDERVAARKSAQPPLRRVAARKSAQPPERQWRYHTHGENWSGQDGTITATSREEAHAKIHAWAVKQVGAGQSIADSDDLGPYVHVDPSPVAADE